MYTSFFKRERFEIAFTPFFKRDLGILLQETSHICMYTSCFKRERSEIA